MTDEKRNVRGFAGMVEPTAPIQLVPTGPENHCCRAPAALSGLGEQALDIMRPDGTLETVKQDQDWSVIGTFEVMDVQEIAVWRVESLH